MINRNEARGILLLNQLPDGDNIAFNQKKGKYPKRK